MNELLNLELFRFFRGFSAQYFFSADAACRAAILGLTEYAAGRKKDNEGKSGKEYTFCFHVRCFVRFTVGSSPFQQERGTGYGSKIQKKKKERCRTGKREGFCFSKKGFYDGKTCTHFIHNGEPVKNGWSIKEDRKGGIWFGGGSETGHQFGLFRFDLKSLFHRKPTLTGIAKSSHLLALRR